jgi:hypothetical protein
MKITICKSKDKPKRRFPRYKKNTAVYILRRKTLPGLQQVFTAGKSFFQLDFNFI